MLRTGKVSREIYDRKQREAELLLSEAAKVFIAAENSGKIKRDFRMSVF